MQRKLTAALLLAGSLTLGAALTACGGDDNASSTTPAAAAATTAAPAATTEAPAATTEAPAATGAGTNGTAAATDPASTAPTNALTTVDANTASAAEIKAALEANGVSNADKWTDEILEYRPYDTSDPTLAKLRDELAKYHPDAATLVTIIASLTV